jgi:kynurenine formamidase
VRFVDLSAPIVSSHTDDAILASHVRFVDHQEGAQEIEAMFGLPPRLLRDGEGWAREILTIGTHNTTHVDAPYHYNSQIKGKPAARIDELPIDLFVGPGVVVDMTSKADGESVGIDDFEAGLDAAGHQLTPRDIVLVRTGRDALYFDPDYMQHGPGVTPEATRWLFEAGVRVMGIDAWGWDRPLRLQAAEALEANATGIFWAAHQVDLPYCQIERLFGLDQLPPTGFTVLCLPLRLVGASAAPARVVAVLPGPGAPQAMDANAI